MSFITVFLCFCLLVLVSILWPLFRGWRDHKKQLRQDARSDYRDAVIKDRENELAETHALGEISETEFKSLKKDLEKTISAQTSAAKEPAYHAITFGNRSRLTLLVICALVPLGAYLMYSNLGAKEDWRIAQISDALEQDQNASREDYLALIGQVKSRLDDKPSNEHLLFMLGKLSSRIGDYEESVQAYRSLKEEFPESPVVVAELAQALFSRAGNIITPEVRENTELALSLDPELPTALGFAGIDAFQNGRYQEAIDHWQRAVKQLNPSSVSSQFLSQGIARAKVALDKAGSSRSESGEGSTPGASVRVAISLGESVTDLSGEETVFVYARAWQGAKIPLAIQRFAVTELPKTLTLDRTMAMADGMDITTSSQLEVVARVSKAGTATPQPGDWTASFGPVILVDGVASVELEIANQLP